MPMLTCRVLQQMKTAEPLQMRTVPLQQGPPTNEDSRTVRAPTQENSGNVSGDFPHIPRALRLPSNEDRTSRTSRHISFRFARIAADNGAVGVSATSLVISTAAVSTTSTERSPFSAA